MGNNRVKYKIWSSCRKFDQNPARPQNKIQELRMGKGITFSLGSPRKCQGNLGLGSLKLEALMDGHLLQPI